MPTSNACIAYQQVSNVTYMGDLIFFFLWGGVQNRRTGDQCAIYREDDNDAEDGIKPIDPLLQLITLFSRSALMERRCVFTAKALIWQKSQNVITGQTHYMESQ